MSLLIRIQPDSVTTVKLPAWPFGNIQRWLRHLREAERPFVSRFHFIAAVWQIVWALFNFIQIFSAEFSWMELGSTVNRSAWPFGKIQRWLRRLREAGRPFESLYQIIEPVYQIGSSLFKLVKIYSAEFSWPKLGSAVCRIYLGVRRLIEKCGENTETTRGTL